MTSINIRFIAASLLAAACIASAHGQALPINAAASVNGLIITNDMVEHLKSVHIRISNYIQELKIRYAYQNYQKPVYESPGACGVHR